METKKQFDGFQFANTIDLSNYSCLVAVGGDGSLSEVANGMLARADKQKLPIAFIPNGSTNWFGITLGFFSNIDMALDALCGGIVSKFSVLECLTDSEDSSEIAMGIEGFKRRRYALG
jgi:diacylglycerol kinase family enzyme